MEIDEKESAEGKQKKRASILDDGEEIQVVNIDYTKCQVVRGEFFAHLNEPSITFNNNKIAVNTACIRRLPDVEYIQIMINTYDNRLYVRPSSEDAHHAFVWVTKGAKRQPKQVTCPVFFAKIIDATGWDPDYRYKLLGKLVRNDGELLFAFDLNDYEKFPRTARDGTARVSRTPIYRVEWEKPFGPTMEEHLKRLQVNIFKNCAILNVVDKTVTMATDTAEKPTEDESGV
jgi:hypothetical protein